jgi:hypothetical protein
LAGYVELILEQAATFNTTVNVNGADGSTVNLANHYANSQIRKSYYSTTAYDLDAAITDAYDGVITLSMTAANTSNLRPGRYVFDLTTTDANNVVTRVVEGIVTVTPGVTK